MSISVLYRGIIHIPDILSEERYAKGKESEAQTIHIKSDHDRKKQTTNTASP